MYNRYQGNSGRVVRVEDSPPRPVPPVSNTSRPPLLPQPLREWETEDIILLLIVYLLYRETRDEELLIMLGAIALL